MPWESDSASSPPVQTCWPFLPMTMAVPVSWQNGRMPRAEISALRSIVRATYGRCRSLRVVEDGGDLGEMGRAEGEIDRLDGLGGEQRESFRGDFQDRLALELHAGNVLAGEEFVFGVIGTERKSVLVAERFLRHGVRM